MDSRTGIALGMAGVGFVMVYSGITNKGVLVNIRDIIQGNKPTQGQGQFPQSGQATGSSNTSNAAYIVGSSSAVIQGVLTYELAQVGKPYIWGGTGPAGYDCSGLTYMAYKSVGINIPRVSEGQILSGVGVPVSQAVPGDLLFPEPGHVVTCLGNHQVIEAPYTGAVIRVRPYQDSEFIVCRRIVTNASASGVLTA